MDLRGRWVLITGASSGIGRETAILLSELEARLVLAGRNVERLEATRQQLHSAGIQSSLPLRVLSLTKLEEVLRINVSAAVMLAKAFCQKGCCGQEGSIVFLSSIAGLAGRPGIAAYSASKGALNALARSLAMELARNRIRVNCVAPGLVQTEMLEQLRELLPPEQLAHLEGQPPLDLGTPRDVAHAIASLLADTARWITGTTLVVDGGYTAQ